MVRFFGVMLCTVGLVFNFSVSSVSAATQKIQTIEKKYSFVDTGAICGVTINGNIRESYVTEGNKVKYTERSGFLGMVVNGNASTSNNN